MQISSRKIAEPTDFRRCAKVAKRVSKDDLRTPRGCELNPNSSKIESSTNSVRSDHRRVTEFHFLFGSMGRFSSTAGKMARLLLLAILAGVENSKWSAEKERVPIESFQVFSARCGLAATFKSLCHFMTDIRVSDLRSRTECQTNLLFSVILKSKQQLMACIKCQQLLESLIQSRV